MRFFALATICAAAFGLSCVLASEPAAATRPTTEPSTRPAADSSSDQEVRRILDALENAGERYATTRADLQYTVDNRMMGYKEMRTGWVAYQKAAGKTPAMLRIEFDTLRLDEGRQFDEKIDYAFDGRQLSIARHKIKQINRYRIAEDQLHRPMRLAEGPFPLPFGQKAEEMLKYFRITTRPARGDEPKNSDYLKLTPRDDDGRQINAVSIEMWVDRDAGLPVKIISVGRDRSTTTVAFDKLQTDVKLDKSTFTLPKPFGWREAIENLSSGARISP
jgi:hypothetical protein